MKLTEEIARKNVGNYIDCYKRKFGYYPMEIIETDGILRLKDHYGVCMLIPKNSTDFNCQDYDYIMMMQKDGKVK